MSTAVQQAKVLTDSDWQTDRRRLRKLLYLRTLSGKNLELVLAFSRLRG
jgi:hypothetical protein